MSIEIKCARCGENVLGHNELTFIGCLSFLSGEIEVYRKNTDKEGSSSHD